MPGMDDDELERRIRAGLAREVRRTPGPESLRLPDRDDSARQAGGRRVVLVAAAAVLLVCGLTALLVDRGTGDAGGPPVVATPTDGLTEDPSGVSCAGEVVTTEPGKPVANPSPATALEAAEAWAGPGVAGIEVDDDERFASVLREDGSVLARLRLDDGAGHQDGFEGWSVDASVSCPDGAAGGSWDGPRLLGCEPAEVVLADVAPDREPDRIGDYAPVPLVLDHRTDETAAVADGEPGTGVVTTTTGNGGPVHTAVRWERTDDRWRITRLAECAGQAPGVPPGREAVLVVRAQANHCWLNPVAYDGTTWEARAEDDFGTGGQVPDRWHGYGTVRRVGDTLRYRDLGGAEVVFLPTGSPGIREKGVCA